MADTQRAFVPVLSACRCFRQWPWHVRVLVMVHVILLPVGGGALWLLSLAEADVRRVAKMGDEQSYGIAWGEGAGWSASSISFDSSEWVIITFMAVNPPRLHRRVTNLSSARWSMRNREVRLRASITTFESAVTWGGRERASSILRETYQMLENAEAASVTLNASVASAFPGPPVTRKTTHRIVVQQAGRLAWTVEGELKNELDIFSDGAKLFVKGRFPFLPQQSGTERMLSSPISGPELMPQMLRSISFNVAGLPTELWNGPDQLIRSLARLEYLGQEPIQGVKCHHIRCDRVEIWVTAGARRLLRRVKTNAGATLHTYDFADWKLNEQVPIDASTFTPSNHASAQAGSVEPDMAN